MERVTNTDIGILNLIDNIEKVIVGKREIVELVTTALLAGGHVLIEDVPGVGKTQLAAALSRSCGGEFNRLQMTPDVMPADVTGFTLINRQSGELEFRKGAVFCNFLLADEINRASPKSQSALLEAMEEGQISIEGKTYELPKPFMVLATQNPVETYGTYSLPEAQMDRFLMKMSIGYPGDEDEIAILKKGDNERASGLSSVISLDEINGLQKKADSVTCSEAVERYIVSAADMTRKSDGLKLGVSPRGSVALHRAVKAYALLCGRDFVLPDDVKYLAPYVWGHRVMLSASGRSSWKDGKEAVRAILAETEIPV